MPPSGFVTRTIEPRRAAVDESAMSPASISCRRPANTSFAFSGYLQVGFLTGVELLMLMLTREDSMHPNSFLFIIKVK